MNPEEIVQETSVHSTPRVKGSGQPCDSWGECLSNIEILRSLRRARRSGIRRQLARIEVLFARSATAAGGALGKFWPYLLKIGIRRAIEVRTGLEDPGGSKPELDHSMHSEPGAETTRSPACRSVSVEAEREVFGVVRKGYPEPDDLWIHR